MSSATSRSSEPGASDAVAASPDLVDRLIPQKGQWTRDQAKQLVWWRAELGARTLADVTPAVIAETRDKLARGVTVRGGQRSPSTVVRHLAALSHAFAVALKQWGWLEDSPLRKVTKPKEPRGRVRYLADDERARLLPSQACSHLPDTQKRAMLNRTTIQIQRGGIPDAASD